MKKILLFVAIVNIVNITNAQWQQTSLDSTAVTCFAINGLDIYTGTSTGVYSSSDYGTNWSLINNGLTNYNIRALTTNGTNIIAGTEYPGTNDYVVMFSSNNNGLNWSPAINGLPDNSHWAQSYSISSLTANGTEIYAGTTAYKGIFISSNNGISWNSCSDNGLPYLSTGSISEIIIDGTNIFISINGPIGTGVYLSTDNGNNWTAMNNGLPTNYPHVINSLAKSGTKIIAGSNAGVFLSNNNGANWAQMNNGLSDTIIHSIVFSGANVFIGTNSGVFLSTNNCANWIAVNNGLTYTNAQKLAICGDTIFAGIYNGSIGKGVWKCSISVLLGIKETMSNDNIAAYPNPTTNNLTVIYNKKSVLEILDLQGQVIKRIKTTEKQTTIDISYLARGIYFLKITTDKGITIEKIIKE